MATWKRSPSLMSTTVPFAWCQRNSQMIQMPSIDPDHLISYHAQIGGSASITKCPGSKTDSIAQIKFGDSNATKRSGLSSRWTAYLRYAENVKTYGRWHQLFTHLQWVLCMQCTAFYPRCKFVLPASRFIETGSLISFQQVDSLHCVPIAHLEVHRLLLPVKPPTKQQRTIWEPGSQRQLLLETLKNDMTKIRMKRWSSNKGQFAASLECHDLRSYSWAVPLQHQFISIPRQNSMGFLYRRSTPHLCQ